VFETLTAEADASLSEGYPSIPPGEEAPTLFLDVTILSGYEAAGKAIVELNIPRTAVLVSVRRGEEIIIPRGDTRLRAGDVVTILCEREVAPAIKELLEK
jgi:Trk K+ transport system NAD-binding subunit